MSSLPASNDAAQNADIVPFGKYKGRPVVDLIADRDYTDWLAAQPWFRERYGNVYNLIVNTGTQPQDTPEHNKMQARYLDHNACLNLLRLWLDDGETVRDRWEKERATKLTARQRANLEVGRFTATVLSATFEAHGWDLLLSCQTQLPVHELAELKCECTCSPDRCEIRKTSYAVDSPLCEVTADGRDWSRCYPYGSGSRTRHCAADCPLTWADEYSSRATPYEAARRRPQEFLWAAVELKPALGDDYPSVLRDVVKRRELARARRVVTADVWVVLADETRFEGVDLTAVRKIFRSQNVALLTSAELPPPSADWQCACKECALP